MKYLKSRNENKNFENVELGWSKMLFAKMIIEVVATNFITSSYWSRDYAVYFENININILFFIVWSILKLKNLGYLLSTIYLQFLFYKNVYPFLQLWRFFKKWCFLLFECSRGWVICGSSKWRSVSSRRYNHDVDDVISNLYVDLFEKYRPLYCASPTLCSWLLRESFFQSINYSALLHHLPFLG
jgi:hypothetical protein